MPRWFWLAAALITLGGAAAGYFTVPHYYRPHDSGEARLRERAVQYYRDQLTFNLGAMQPLMTPAHQIGSTDALKKLAQKNRDETSKARPELVKAQQALADALKPEALDVQIDGDWAVVGGNYTVPAEGNNQPLTLPLTKSVWVRRAGDWWNFLLEADEVACYGNPPDFAREIVARHNFNQQATKMLTAPGAAPPAASPAPGQPPAKPGAAPPPSGSAPAAPSAPAPAPGSSGAH